MLVPRNVSLCHGFGCVRVLSAAGKEANKMMREKTAYSLKDTGWKSEHRLESSMKNEAISSRMGYMSALGECSGCDFLSVYKNKSISEPRNLDGASLRRKNRVCPRLGRGELPRYGNVGFITNSFIRTLNVFVITVIITECQTPLWCPRRCGRAERKWRTV